MPTNEEMRKVLCRHFPKEWFYYGDAIRDLRALFANPEPDEPKPEASAAETARIQGFADGLAKGIEHRSGRMSVRLEIAKDLLAGLDDPTVAEDADIARALAIADAMIAADKEPRQ